MAHSAARARQFQGALGHDAALDFAGAGIDGAGDAAARHPFDDLRALVADFQRLGAGELFGLMESRERTFYETFLD